MAGAVVRGRLQEEWWSVLYHGWSGRSSTIEKKDVMKPAGATAVVGTSVVEAAEVLLQHVYLRHLHRFGLHNGAQQSQMLCWVYLGV